MIWEPFFKIQDKKHICFITKYNTTKVLLSPRQNLFFPCTLEGGMRGVCCWGHNKVDTTISRFFSSECIEKLQGGEAIGPLQLLIVYYFIAIARGHRETAKDLYYRYGSLKIESVLNVCDVWISRADDHPHPRDITNFSTESLRDYRHKNFKHSQGFTNTHILLVAYRLILRKKYHGRASHSLRTFLLRMVQRGTLHVLCELPLIANS